MSTANIVTGPNVRVGVPVKQNNTTDKVFLIVLIIVSLLFIVIFGYNAYLYNRIRINTDETTPVNRAEANTLFWLNIIWIVVALAVLVWTIIKLIGAFSQVKAPAPVYIHKPVLTQAPVLAQQPVVIQQVPVVKSVSNAPVPLYSTSPLRQTVSSMRPQGFGECKIN